MTKFYITSAIPYATQPPHIGNAIDFILADTLSRYHQKQDESVFFSTGADEHGQKVAKKAADAGVTPQKYTDAMDIIFKQFAQTLGIEYSYWIRTTETKHAKAAQAIWKKIEPFIYKKQYSGLYCEGCERFVTEKESKENKGVCPDHNKPYVTISEENYFFKLSEFTDKVKDVLETGTFNVVPVFRRNEALALLKEGLEDISISRDASRMDWGVPVPGDKGQVMYVWFEALLNYISTLDYPNGENYKKFWSPDVQVIGKDIIRFHAVIWPAILLAADIPLPKTLLVHGHVQSSGQKMSKTIGNIIEPKQIVATYGLDAFRYYFLRHIPSQEDGDFTWEKFENAYNNELGNELGNLVQRIAAMVIRYQDGVIGQIPEPTHDVAPYNQAIEEFHLDRAIDYVWTLIRGLNQYIEEEKPWHIAKEDDPEHLQEVLATSVGSLLQIADLLEPFLPHAAKLIAQVFEKGIVKPYHGVLFPRINNHTEASAPKQ